MLTMLTVKEFAEACKDLSHEEIYTLFEFEISQELRDAIYEYADLADAEPCRDALRAIGEQYNIQSLIEY